MPTKILVIDDEESILVLLNDFLTSHNYDVYTASNGEKALKILEQTKIDLIITDIVMPEMSGIRIIYEVRKKNRNVSIIAISGSSQSKEFNNLGIAKEMGAVAIFEKPFDLDELLETIRKTSE